MLYPTELLRLIQKIFNFRLQPDSNELPLRRRTLYPTELLAHNITIVYDGLRFVKKLGNFLILLNIQKN